MRKKHLATNFHSARFFCGGFVTAAEIPNSLRPLHLQNRFRIGRILDLPSCALRPAAQPLSPQALAPLGRAARDNTC
jgi:hypothetical protein